jgi:hypothetical protein
MKKNLLTTVLALLTINTSFAQEIWDDFDNAGKITYAFVNGGLNESFANPATGGINPSALCARYGRSTQTFDVIVIDPSGTLIVDDVSDYLSGTKKMSMKIFSPYAGATVQITLENKTAAQPTNYPLGRHSEYTATTSTSLTWETIEFTFSNQPDNTVANTAIDRMVILFAPNTNADDIFIFDDLMGPEFADPCASVTPDQTIGDDFECQRNVSFDFSNGNLIVEANPLSSGINTTDKVAKFTKWTSGVTDGAFGGSLTYPFNSGQYKTANIMLYSPAPSQSFLMIFQDASNNNLKETTFTTTSTSQWVEYKMDLSTIPSTTTISKFVLLLNPATVTEDIIYLDNFRFTNDNSVGVEEVAKNNLSIFPNPTSGLVKFQSEQNITAVVISDNTGRIIKTSNHNNNKLDIDMSDFEGGFYHITITYSNTQTSSHKVLKLND